MVRLWLITSKAVVMLTLLLIAVESVGSGTLLQGEEDSLIGLQRARPIVHIPKTQKFPKDLGEAKRWVKEAFYLWCEALVARKTGKPKAVWQDYYQEAARLAKGVFEKFGDITVVWLVPENEWGEIGDIVLYPEQIKKDYEEILKFNIPPADPALFYGLALAREARKTAEERGIRPKHGPFPADSSPLATLQDAYYQLGRWKEAMEAIELYMQSLPYFVDYVFERWIECARKVYRKGAIPTKFLLVQKDGRNLIQAPGAEGVRRKEITQFLVPITFLGGRHWASVEDLSKILEWKVYHQGENVVVEGPYFRMMLKVGQRKVHINGQEIDLGIPIQVSCGSKIMLPLQLVASLARAKVHWEKAMGFIRFSF